MELNKNYIVAGASLFAILLLILLMFSGVFFLLPRQLYLIINGTFPLIILALLIIALIALMTGSPKGTSEKILSSTVIIGLLVIIAGIFVPIMIFEAFFHNQGQAYEIPDYPDNQTAHFSRENTTLIDICHKDGWGILLKPDDPDYHAIKAECLEQIRRIRSQVKTGFSRDDLIAMKQKYTSITILFPAPAEFNTSCIADGEPMMITVDEAVFFLDSEYDDLIITPSQSGTGVWNTSGDRGRLGELTEPVFRGFSDDYQKTKPVYPEGTEEKVSVESVSRLSGGEEIILSGYSTLPEGSMLFYEIISGNAENYNTNPESFDGTTGFTEVAGTGETGGNWSVIFNPESWRDSRYIVNIWPENNGGRNGDTKVFYIPLNDTIMKGAGIAGYNGEIILSGNLFSEESRPVESVTPEETPRPSDDGDHPISIVITSPANGTKFHSDVVPHQVRVLANISSTYEIVRVTLDSGWETVEAEEPLREIDEEIRVDSSGERSIVVTAYDEKGNSISETTAFTIIIGPPVDPRYSMRFTIHGEVTDSNGEPVSNCQVQMNSSVYKYLGVYMGSSNTTDINGRYLIANVYGPEIMITADKDGYLQYKSTESFENADAEFNIVMVPEGKVLSLPFFITILSTGLAIFFRIKRN